MFEGIIQYISASIGGTIYLGGRISPITVRQSGAGHWEAGVFTDADDFVYSSSVAVSPTHSALAYASLLIGSTSRRTGVVRSEDNGKTWRLVNNDGAILVRSVDALDPRIVYGSSGLHIVTSTDGGSTFQVIRSLANLPLDPLNDYIVSITVDRHSMRVWVALRSGVILTSDRTFQDWVVISVSPDLRGIRSVDVSHRDTSVLIVVLEDGSLYIYRHGVETQNV